MLKDFRTRIIVLLLYLMIYAVAYGQIIIPVKHNYINNSITAIVQDDYGFIWIGTMRGLMRYDGYSYKTFKNAEAFPVAKNVIKCIFKDSKGNIWTGTNEGGSKYEYESGLFYPLGSKLKDLSVNTINEAPNGIIVIGTERGVALLDPVSMAIHFVSQADNANLFNDKITYSATDNSGNIWLAGNNGFYRLTFDSGREKPTITSWMEKRHLGFFDIDKFDNIWFCDSEVLCKSPVPKGNSAIRKTILSTKIESRCILFGKEDIWIGTTYGGIDHFTLDAKGEATFKEKLWIDKTYPNNLCNYIYAINSDKQGNIWLGTIDGLFRMQKTDLSLFKTISQESDGLSHNVVACVYEGKNNDLWVGTSGGLDRLTFNNGQPRITNFYDNSDNEYTIFNNRIQSLLIDNKGIMWLGSRRGISYFDPSTGKFFRNPKTDSFLNDNDASFIKDLHKDFDGNIWMGFLYGGLMMYDQKNDKLHNIRLKDLNISISNIQTIIHDKQGNLWFGTKKEGLFRIDSKDLTLDGENKFTNYTVTSKTDSLSLPSNGITTLYCDHNNNIVVGTSEGLCIYNKQKDAFRQVNLSQTGENDYVCSITEDMNGVMWIFTNHGIYRYILGNNNPLFYEINNGVFARIDYQASSCMTKDGTIYSSGIKGVTYFDPENITPDTVTLPVYISNFSILNKEVLPGSKQLAAEINKTREIVLTHDDYQFSFEFSSLWFSDRSSVKYAYKLEGFDEDWVYIDGQRNYISYSNLPAGSYVLHLKSTNGSGMWTNGSMSILIKILPPWWATWWSYLIYIALFALIAIVTYRYFNARIQYRRKEEENKWKQSFYINVTHGFKTPLTLLQVPLEILRKNKNRLSKQDTEHLYTIIDKNVKRLSNMIYQLIEFGRIDRKKVAFRLVEMDFILFMQHICDSFKELFGSKNITLSFQSNVASADLTFDPEKIETAIFNLLLNAFNYTNNAEGKVFVTCRLDAKDQKLWVSIKDNGIGISPEHQKKIFERFWQVREENHLASNGAGLGLSLSKEFIELHKGKIFVESEYGEGSTFSFYLPLGSSHFGSKYYIDTESELVSPARASNIIDAERIISYTIDKLVVDEDAPLVYILSEDNDILHLIQYILSTYRTEIFEEVTVLNEAVSNKLPSMIIVDNYVKVNDLNLDLCRSIKSNQATNHIPVIILIPEESREDILTFYNIGIDSFFEKPFDITIFQARIKSLLQNRKNIKERLKMDIIAKPKQDIIESADDKFMNSVMELIEKNMANEEFSLVDFANQMNMSRSVLHSRIQAIVDQSPMEFLRNIRMKKAEQLLLTEAYNVTQISYMVGFSDSGYFSTYFKKQYGMTPREYVRNAKNNENRGAE